MFALFEVLQLQASSEGAYDDAHGRATVSLPPVRQVISKDVHSRFAPATQTRWGIPFTAQTRWGIPFAAQTCWEIPIAAQTG